MSDTSRGDDILEKIKPDNSPQSVAAEGAVVVLGATGDLAGKKIFPGLFALHCEGRTHPQTRIIAFARRKWDHAKFRESIRPIIEKAAAKLSRGAAEVEEFLSRTQYVRGELDDPAGYKDLAELLGGTESRGENLEPRLFFFAIAPEYFLSAVRNLRESGAAVRCTNCEAEHRLIIEKPFGTDYNSATELNAAILRHFDERQVYRIDHYLGKETVQNIFALRFGNSIFEPLWSSQHIERIEITVAETIGMEGRRAQYFDATGMLRDVFQNHVLQLMCLTCIGPPGGFDGDSLRDEKVRMLRSVRVMSAEEVTRNVVIGQYSGGVADGEQAKAYIEEDLVEPNSRTETYIAARLEIDSWRWAGVPVFLRTGKRLARRASEIAVTFRQPPVAFFPTNQDITNVLVIRIQPDEGVSLRFVAKAPGFGRNVHPVKMDFHYGTSFGARVPEAYERLLLDALLGDRTLFMKSDEIELSWAIVQPILDVMASTNPPVLHQYEAGSWGPGAADDLLQDFNTGWRRL